MFYVSLLLNQMIGWMRTQSGTTSLRALLYMDEVFGFLPPTASPPRKKPMLTPTPSRGSIIKSRNELLRMII